MKTTTIATLLGQVACLVSAAGAYHGRFQIAEPTGVDVDVRIGVTNAPREIALELSDDTDVGALKADIEAALSSESVLWVTDKTDRQIGISGAKIAYVEIGTAARGRMGFATA